MYNNELQHHGVKGMHWGVRRYQNYDGSLTDEGRKKKNNRSRSKSEEKYYRAEKRKQVLKKVQNTLIMANNVAMPIVALYGYYKMMDLQTNGSHVIKRGKTAAKSVNLNSSLRDLADSYYKY